MRGLVVVLAAIAGGMPACADAQVPSPIGSADFAVAGLTEDTDSTEIRRVLGTPDSVVVHENPFDTGGKLPTHFYRDITIHYAYGSTPVGFMLTGPDFETERGLKVGDSMERVRQLYGEPGYPDGETWEFTDPEDLEGLHVIRVDFVGDRVRRIYVGWLFD
jgi:hypothetical protein